MLNDRKPYARSKFTADEDSQLRSLVGEYGLSAWVEIAKRMPGRNARQCRERWKHYLSLPELSRPWTEADDALLFDRVSEMGPKWTRIARSMGNRTDIEVKMRWMKRFNGIVRLLPKRQRARPPAPFPLQIPAMSAGAPIPPPSGSRAGLASSTTHDRFECPDIFGPLAAVWGRLI
jgi:hypothetical protein